MKYATIKKKDIANMEFKVEFECTVNKMKESHIELMMADISLFMAKHVNDVFLSELKKFPKKYKMFKSAKSISELKKILKSTGLHIAHFEGEPGRIELWKGNKFIKRIF